MPTSYRHGVYVSEATTDVSTMVRADVAIPFVIGAAPVQSAENPADVGMPKLCTSFSEFVAAFGYSDDWGKYNLCEFAYSHFKLYGCQPVIFCNLLDPATMNQNIAASDFSVSEHRAELPIEVINDTNLVVKASGGAGSAYAKNTDYVVSYANGKCYVELIPTSTHYSETSLNIAYKKVKPDSVTSSVVASGLEAIEMCMSTVGVIPDLIAAPGFSGDSEVAAVMATKASGINSLFRGKAVIDLEDCDDYTDAYATKIGANLVDENQIVCWPMVKLGEKQFHMSTALCGLMALVDTENGGIPYESPSNKNFLMDALVLEDGSIVNMTKAAADSLNSNGIVTALNFLSMGWVCWGNYTACYPANTDVKDYFIPVSRMFDYVGNTLVKTFWSKIDRPMTRVLFDNVIDTVNIWLNGLVGAGYLLGGRAELNEEENPLTDLMAGIMRVHIFLTPPSPAQEIDFTLEYDISYLSEALGG